MSKSGKKSGKHRSDIKFCYCFHCSRGLSDTWGKFVAQHTRRRFRRNTKATLKEMIKTGNFDGDVPDRISAGYTD